MTFIAKVTTSIALLAVPVMLDSPPAFAEASTIIPAGTQLFVSDEAPGGNVPLRTLASVNVTTTSPNETRKLRTYMPVVHTRTGSVVSPDRFFFAAKASCEGGAGYPALPHARNILAKDSATLAPKLFVTFPDVGTYTCKIEYKFTTSYIYDDDTDDMKLRTDGYIFVGDPLPSWAEQCYWPAELDGVAEDCELVDESGAASAAIQFGESLDRTPVRVSIPAGTTVRVTADAYTTTCGGTGGGSDMLLCGDDLGSFRPSRVRSVISVDVVGSSDPECDPVLEADENLDGRAWRDIPVKVHHEVVYNTLQMTTTTNATCPTAYDIKNTLTVTSGETVVSHQAGTILFVEDYS